MPPFSESTVFSSCLSIALFRCVLREAFKFFPIWQQQMATSANVVTLIHIESVSHAYNLVMALFGLDRYRQKQERRGAGTLWRCGLGSQAYRGQASYLRDFLVYFGIVLYSLDMT